MHTQRPVAKVLLKNYFILFDDWLTWQVVDSLTPHTTRCIPSTQTLSSMVIICLSYK